MRVPPRPSPFRLLAPVGAHRTSHRAPLLDVSRAGRYEANAKTAPSKFAANFELWEQTLDARKKVYRTVNRCGASVEDACRYPCEEVRAAAPTPYPLLFFFPKTKSPIPPARDVTRRFRPARVRRCATTWIRRCSRVLNPPARRAPAATRAPRNASSRHPAAASATPLRATRRDLEAPLEAPLEATRRDRRPVRADPRGRRRRVRSEGHLFLLLLLLLLLRPPVHRPLPDHPTGRRRDPGLLRRLAVERRRAPSAAATATTTKATTTRTRG